MKSGAFFTREFNSDFHVMTRALNEAIAALLEAGCITPEMEPSTRLCLEEALVNAIRHGNQCEVKRKVRLSLSREGDTCLIRIWDEGAGFHPEQVELPETDQLGGRGICLIRHYMDQVRYNESEGCLEMRLYKRGPQGVAGHG